MVNRNFRYDIICLVMNTIEYTLRFKIIFYLIILEISLDIRNQEECVTILRDQKDFNQNG